MWGTILPMLVVTTVITVTVVAPFPKDDGKKPPDPPLDG